MLLARLLRLGEIVAIEVLSVEQEAARDLVRVQEDVRGDVMRARHRTVAEEGRVGPVDDGDRLFGELPPCVGHRDPLTRPSASSALRRMTAAAAAAMLRGVMTLRATVEADLPALTALEVDDDTRRWLGDTSVEWHRAALRDGDQEHLILEDDGRICGLAVLAGLDSPHGGVELRRLVIATHQRGRGFGRRAVRRVLTRAFDTGAHRVWLDVKAANTRARAVYQGEGFVVEGVLPEAVREDDGSWSSLVVMAKYAS